MTNKKIIIFIPGYYGSTLLNPSTGREVWGDAREIFFSRSTLAMPIPGMSIPGAMELVAHQLIPDKKVLGGLLKEDAYDKTISLLKDTSATEIISIAWDWRRDPLHGVIKLDEEVKKAKKKYPDHQFQLVSHSFGSLVASYYLRFGAKDYFEANETWEGLKHFSSVVLSACPFRGLMAIFRNMHYGIKFGLNHNLQTPLAFSTFESSYYLLPPPGLDKVLDENQNILSLNLHDPVNWHKNKWGLFHHGLKFSDETLSVRSDYLSLHLGRARKFHELIDSPLENHPDQKIPLLYSSGFGSKTVHHGVWLNNLSESSVFLYYPKNFKKWKSKLDPDVVYGDGDSTIPDFSLKLPCAFEEIGTSIIQQKLGHLESLQHKDSQKIIFDFLVNDKP